MSEALAGGGALSNDEVNVQSLPASLKVAPQRRSFGCHLLLRSPQGWGVLLLFVMFLELWRRKLGSLIGPWDLREQVLGERPNSIRKSEAEGACVFLFIVLVARIWKWGGFVYKSTVPAFVIQ